MEGKLTYNATGFDASNDIIDTDTHYINLARDLSALNRKGMEQTTRKGVPLVYHCKLTIYRNFTDRLNSSLFVSPYVAASNWVTRNGAVKLHAAREAMFKNAGIKKSDRGRYDKTIRYGWDSHAQTWATPVFSDGSFTHTDMGEWDLSKFAIDQDAELVPTLYGPTLNEGAASTGNSFNMMTAYLNSRRKPETDDATSGHEVADHSIIRSMFNVEDERDDELQIIADDNQDQTPYNTDASRGTFTAFCLAEVAACGNFGKPKDVVYFDAPFGMARLDLVKSSDTAGDLNGDVAYTIEVVGISEMQD